MLMGLKSHSVIGGKPSRLSHSQPRTHLLQSAGSTLGTAYSRHRLPQVPPTPVFKTSYDTEPVAASREQGTEFQSFGVVGEPRKTINEL